MANQPAPRRIFALVSEDGFVLETSQDSVFFEYREKDERVFEYVVGKEIDLTTVNPEEYLG